MKMKLIFLTLMILIFSLSIENTFAISEPILITKSSSMEHVIFDGKWTNYSEWKQSSHNPYTFGDGEIIIHLRTAHFENYIYVFVDPVNDLTLDEKMDEATICFDGKNNKSKIPDKDDYCFSVSLGQKQGILKQGLENKNFNILDTEDFIAISSVSDENDRYTTTPHPSYEFKIPIELLERSDNYGFYLSVYDASLDKFYSWPENSSGITSPSTWGNIVSPDKSLPELNLPILIFAILIFTIIIVQSKVRIGLLQ
jgi:hypothetical protein